MEGLVENLAEQWRQHHSICQMTSEHQCSMEQCNITHIVGGVWSNGTEEHCCVRVLCKNHPKWANRGTLKKQIRNIYMCQSTGTSHFCN